ncbi:MAG: hypothetical protein RLW87_07980 [Alphaproteobacteria bacterium]
MPKQWKNTAVTILLAAFGCIGGLWFLKWADENDIPFFGDVGDFFS